MAGSALRHFQLVIFRILTIFSILAILYMLLDWISFPAFLHLHYIYYLTVILYLVWIFNRLRFSQWHVRQFLLDVFIVLLIGITIIPVSVVTGIISVRILIQAVSRYASRTGDVFVLGSIRMTPSRALLTSFAGVILIGTLFLMLPSATVDHKGASFVDALFTATSATCVTGLIVRDTGTYFSLFGQFIILILIQLGGLGIMTFSTLFALIIGRKIGLRTEETLRNILGEQSRVDMPRLIIGIVQITLFFELIGTLILFIRFLPEQGFAMGLYSALFHSVAAFCNAGFSIYAKSLTGYVGDITVNAVVMILIVAGGLGFFVMNDLIKKTRGWNPFTLRWKDLTVHTKLVLVTTLVLILAGALVVFFFEFDNSMLHLSTFDKFMASVFQSITFRTAGFNTIDISQFRAVTLFIAVLFMFIGASPSSTGGGIKTTTIAVLVLSIKSMFQSGDRVEIYKRTIPTQTMLQSISIFMFSLSFLVCFVMLLVATQPFPFLNILFEATSALGTVGLSTGITSKLDDIGKLLIIMLMYAGRVGPVSVALAIRESRKVNVSYPEARIGVG